MIRFNRGATLSLVVSNQYTHIVVYFDQAIQPHHIFSHCCQRKNVLCYPEKVIERVKKGNSES